MVEEGKNQSPDSQIHTIQTLNVSHIQQKGQQKGLTSLAAGSVSAPSLLVKDATKTPSTTQKFVGNVKTD